MKNNSGIDVFMNICNYIMWFFIGNLYFLICNLPLCFFFIFIGIKNVDTALPLFLLVSLPFGPAVTALLYVMGKLVKEKDLSITKSFFTSYKNNFKQSLLLWTLQLLLLTILHLNIQFFSISYFGYLLIPFFYIAIFLISVLGLYAYPLIAKFHISLLEVIKASLTISIYKFPITIGNLIILIFAMILIDAKPSYAVLFISSITCYLLMFLQKDLHKELELKSVSNS